LLGLTAALIGTALLQLRRESQLTRLRSDFISGVSHELRTPLAQIRMFSETLTLGRVRSDEERRRSLAIIDQEARRLTHLVENLLHFSRSERQTTHITPEPTALAPLVQEVLDGFAPLAAARGATLAATVPEDLVVPADPGAVRQMLLNLLDNAVKYGPQVKKSASAQSATIASAGCGWTTVDRASRAPTASASGSGSGDWSATVARPSPARHRARGGAGAGGSASRTRLDRYTSPDAGGGGTRVVIELPHDRPRHRIEANPGDRGQSRSRVRVAQHLEIEATRSKSPRTACAGSRARGPAIRISSCWI